MSQESAPVTSPLSPVAGPSPALVNGCHQRPDLWLNKFCTELGYHSLSFLANYGGVGSIPGSAAEPEVISEEPDGCLGIEGIKLIKAVIVVLLEHLIDKKLKTECDGCAVDHPSQTRHSCLYEPSAYYFYTVFNEITEALFKPGLKNILARALKAFGLTPHLQRIQGSAETVLCELRDEMYIQEQLASLRQKLVDETCEQIVYDAVDAWKTAAPASTPETESL